MSPVTDNEQALARFVKNTIQNDAGVLDPNVVNGLPGYLADARNRLTSLEGRATAIEGRLVGKDYGLVTALPGSPAMGDRCVYTDSLTAPTFAWRLVYDASQTAGNRWLCIGGAPKIVAANVQRGITNVGSMAAVPTDPITFNLPLAGDWDITQTCTLNNAAAGAFCGISYSIGATAAADWTNGWALLGYGPGASNTLGATLTRTWRHTGRAAADTIAEKAQTSAGTSTIGARSIAAIPMRVG